VVGEVDIVGDAAAADGREEVVEMPGHLRVRLLVRCTLAVLCGEAVSLRLCTLPRFSRVLCTFSH
jgi:hypothetical protein